MTLKVGILHPGKMGSSLALAAQRNNNIVYWASDSRSVETRSRAEAIGMIEFKSITEVAKECDVIISICMGGGVVPNASAVIASGFKGIYVDANHIGDRSHEQHLKRMIEDAGISYIDSAIYGWPYPHESDPYGERTIYLSGEKAEVVKSILHGDIFDCVVTEESSKEIKRKREIEDRQDCAPHIDHGYGIVEFPNIINIDDSFIDEYMKRRDAVEPIDYYIDDDGFYINRGGYKFTKEQVDEAPRRYLNLTPDGCPQEDIDFHREIEIAISKCINAYRGIYPEVQDCVRWRTDAHLAAYGPGGGMGMHHDNAIGGASENENPIFNVLSLSMIVSDRCTGGNLVMKYINKSFPPRKGTVIIYPSGFLGSHAVEKVESGLRISYLEFFGQGSISGQAKPI